MPALTSKLASKSASLQTTTGTKAPMLAFKVFLDSLKHHGVEQFTLAFELWEEANGDLRSGGARVLRTLTSPDVAHFLFNDSAMEVLEQFLAFYSNRAYPKIEINCLYHGSWEFDLTQNPYQMAGELEKVESDIQPTLHICFEDTSREVTVLTDGTELTVA